MKKEEPEVTVEVNDEEIDDFHQQFEAELDRIFFLLEENPVSEDTSTAAFFMALAAVADAYFMISDLSHETRLECSAIAKSIVEDWRVQDDLVHSKELDRNMN